MGLTLIEKILAKHSGQKKVRPGEFIDVKIDVRAARDFGGANVVKNIIENDLSIDNPSKTFFTFDCNPTGSDQNYAANQHYCRQFARKNNIKVFDVNEGIGTHLVIEKGIVVFGDTFVSTDSHANILGAIGAFGQGMGDQDVAAAFAFGTCWFKAPRSVKIILQGKRPNNLSAKSIALNLLNRFGANKLLGCSVEIYGEEVDKLSLDERITISSMATEMGAIIILFQPSDEIITHLEKWSGRDIERISADVSAHYDEVFYLDLKSFVPMMSRPGRPHDAININELNKIKIDSAFIGSCTNGRYEDMIDAARVLKDRKVAPGVVLKIVPATDAIWMRLLDEGLIKIFKDSGALVSNAGCAGCADGQIGQNGPGEITVSTGNRNFAGKQGAGMVYLGSPADVAASAIAGYITTEDAIPDEPELFPATNVCELLAKKTKNVVFDQSTCIEGKVWIIDQDNIDTDMIYHNRYLAVTDITKMGKFTFDNLKDWNDFSRKVEPGDIVVTGENFGSGSSRQQAVDCFKSLGIGAILAKSFGSIYERNAINAALPILKYDDIKQLGLKQRDRIQVDFESGIVSNLENGKVCNVHKFTKIQMEIYKRDGLLRIPCNASKISTLPKSLGCIHTLSRVV